MRVSHFSNFDNINNSVHKTKSRMENLQAQAASLKKVNTPSDNPTGASKILEIRTEKVNNDQFLNNARLAETFLNYTDHSLEEMAEIVMRAKEIAINQSSGASANDETRYAVAEEVGQLFEQAISLGNTRVADRYLFGGYKNNQAPVSTDGKYLGDTGETMLEIGRDAFIAMNIPGIEIFNTNPKASADGQTTYGRTLASNGQESIVLSGFAPQGEENVNLFSELRALRIGMLTNDMTVIRNTLDRFDQILSNVVATRAKIGARISGLNGSIRTMERQGITHAKLNSELEDADLAQVMSDISKEETLLNGVLKASNKLIEPSLMDFLR